MSQQAIDQTQKIIDQIEQECPKWEWNQITASARRLEVFIESLPNSQAAFLVVATRRAQREWDAMQGAEGAL